MIKSCYGYLVMKKYFIWDKIFRITLIIISIFLIVMLALPIDSIGQQQSIVEQEFTRDTLAKVLVERLKTFKLLAPKQEFDQISSLPGYPTASFTIVSKRYLNESTSPVPVYIFKSITMYGKVIASYDRIASNKISLAEVLGSAVISKYKEALDAFYHYVPMLAYGIPSGFYDPQRLVGFKELYIPKQFELRYKLKPRLLLVMIGLSDGEWVKNPVYIYYFGFETTGITYEDVFTRVTIVLAIVLDENNVLYVDRVTNVGIVFYYTIATSTPLTSSLPLTIIYGFLGILFALATIFIEFDEEYKFYVTVFIVFVIQLFSFIALNAIAGISLDELYGVILSIGPWFIILILLWIAPYLFISYKFYITIEEKETLPSHFSAVIEGLLLAIATMIIALSIVFIRPITWYIVAISGGGGVYILVVLLALLDVYIGLTIGKLWATFGRYSEALTSPSMH